MNSAENNVTIV